VSDDAKPREPSWIGRLSRIGVTAERMQAGEVARDRRPREHRQAAVGVVVLMRLGGHLTRAQGPGRTGWRARSAAVAGWHRSDRLE
jgi:hypothetical protein